MPQKEALTVKEWHEALNTNDSKKLLSLVDNNIKLAGPRGADFGAAVLVNWMEKTRIKMLPMKYYQKGNIVVVEERIEWHNTETGELKDSYIIASAFTVKNEKVEGIMRYNDLDAALAAEKLTEEDAVII